MKRDQIRNTSEIDQVINKIDNEIQLADLFHILYLKPIECVLDQVKNGLPQGLKVVQRKLQDRYQNQYELKQLKPIHSYEKYSQLSQEKKNKIKEQYLKKIPQGQRNKYSGRFPTYIQYAQAFNGDNLLAQMIAHGQMQMAICICMYNEDRGMLNNTLLGVGQNIVKLYKQGIDPDKIAVIIIQDGIQKMDSSILQLFHVLECESGMRFNVNKQKDIEQSIKKISNFQETRSQYGWTGEDNTINLNGFLFTQEEEQKRNSLRFVNVKKEYDEIRKLQKEVEALQKRKNITYQDLPMKALDFFKIECKKYMTGDTEEDALKGNEEQSVDKYFKMVSSDLQKSKPLVQNALAKAKQFCNQYINSRLQMSHVSFFRTSQFFPQNSGYSIQELDQLSQLKTATLINMTKSDQQIPISQKSILLEFNHAFAIKMNIFFVIKYRNNQKLSSHNWFFNGFCKEFNNYSMDKKQILIQENQSTVSPKYTILLDVGLRPEEQALVKMYNSMENNHTIGGVCGYMGLKLERADAEQSRQNQGLDFFTRIILNFVDIQRAQQLQYNFAHLIDKGFQSIFKFIHVLPGAFSGYNMNAIWGKKGEEKADELLKGYFKSIGDKVANDVYTPVNLSFIMIVLRVILPNFILKFIDPVGEKSAEHLMYQSNVYLAEDRILCMGIHKNGFDLMFLPDAYSFVDPVKDIPSLLGQRKRWINGSYFAFEKVSDQFSQISCCQVVNLQIWYLAFMNMLAFIAPGFYLFSISVGMQAFQADVLTQLFSNSIPADSPIWAAFVFTINFVYAILIFGLIYYSMCLTNRNQKFVRFVYGVSTVVGVMSLIQLVILVVDLARGLGRSSSYLISNQDPTFIQAIPGGQATVDLLRYITLGIMGLYAVPLVFYSVIFCNLRIIFEVLAGALSFAFYTPTYLIILNVYALCRMDDLSWGTKGLDAGSGGKDSSILDSWKIIRTIHVGKLVFWNVITAGLLIHFGSDYLIRFYLTFALMVIIGGTMLLKVLLAVVYYVYYKICIRTSPSHGGQLASNQREPPSLYKQFRSTLESSTTMTITKSKLQTEIRQDIQRNIQEMLKASGLSKDVTLATLNMFSYIRPTSNNKNQGQKLGSQVIDFISKIQKQTKQRDQKVKKVKDQLAHDKFTNKKGYFKHLPSIQQTKPGYSNNLLSPQFKPSPQKESSSGFKGQVISEPKSDEKLMSKQSQKKLQNPGALLGFFEMMTGKKNEQNKSKQNKFKSSGMSLGKK